jgi:hypothetical protein
MHRKWTLQNTGGPTGHYSTEEVARLIAMGSIPDSASVIDAEDEAYYSPKAWSNAFAKKPPLQNSGDASQPRKYPAKQPIRNDRHAKDQEHVRRENLISYAVMLAWVLAIGGCGWIIANMPQRRPDPYWDHGDGRAIRDEQDYYDNRIPRGR